MIEVTYLGPDQQNHARLGPISPGSRLHLTEEEAYTVRQDACWRLAKAAKDAPVRVPQRGRYFDLVALPWHTRAIFNAVRRLGRGELMKALTEMEACGFEIPPGVDRMDITVMREILLENARIAGWY